MICACVVMLCINIFAWNFSSISLMMIAAAVSNGFYYKDVSKKKAGAAE